MAQAYFTKKFEAEGILSSTSITGQAWTDRRGLRGEWHYGAQPLQLGIQWEGRINLAWKWTPNANTHLKLMATFDVDNSGLEELWEGGVGQFITQF